MQVFRYMLILIVNEVLRTINFNDGVMVLITSSLHKVLWHEDPLIGGSSEISS
jgi:hypothetical protein